MPIPNSFNSDGLLAPGTYDASISDIRVSILVQGDGSSLTWDKAWRDSLLDRASILINQLWSVGVNDIYLDGSFVEDKDHPNDIDGYFDPHLSMYNPIDAVKFAKLVSNLNNLDQHKVWNWDPSSRRAVRGFHKLQLPMWIFYNVELYPHLDQRSGITDSFGNNLKFPSAFRQSRNGFKQKGIVRVIK